MNSLDGINRILHVDDDPDMLRYVSNMLTPRYEVLSLQDPSQCLSELIRTGCRVIVLDIDLGTHNGIDLLKQIKKFDSGIHVIMLTGLVDLDTVLTTMREGAEACLFKPVQSGDEMIEVLQASFTKIDRWYASLRDLQYRRRQGTAPPIPVLAN